MRLKGLIAFGVAAIAIGYVVPSAITGSARQAAGTLAGLVQAPAHPLVAAGSVTGAPAPEEIRAVGLEIGSIPAPPTPIPAPRLGRVVAPPPAPLAPLQMPAPAGNRPPVAEPAPVPAPGPGPVRVPASPPGTNLAINQTISGTATSYCLTGTTATGTQAGPGAIAVDPRVIRLGSHLYVTGYGYGYATDTGGAIQGTLIDLWKTCDDAIRWGRRPVTIYVLDS